MRQRPLLRLIGAGLIASAAMMSGCTKTESIVCDGTTPSFASDVKPIIQSSCALSGCHASGSRNGDFTSYSGLYADLVNGQFNREVLVNRTMPEGSSLSTSQLQTLQCWYDNGYENN
ncbi:MAG: hypothetical protein KDC28_02770 [Saprospiraceae bacterium]|nr:hypothetical protein [Saprospiraceae bacterium]MCB9319330.1 hypothetical protein [Lewinellaceae bacterium]